MSGGIAGGDLAGQPQRLRGPGPAPRRTGRTAPSGRPRAAGTRSEVTTPKLPPPPRIAQNRSGFSSAEARSTSPVGGDHLGRDQVVDAQAELAGQPAHAAAQREPADAGVADQPGRARPGRGPGWPRPGRPAARRRRPAPAGRPGRSRPSLSRLRSIIRPPSQTAVPAVLCAPPRTGYLQPVLARERHRRGDVGGRSAAGDHRRAPVDLRRSRPGAPSSKPGSPGAITGPSITARSSTDRFHCRLRHNHSPSRT